MPPLLPSYLITRLAARPTAPLVLLWLAAQAWALRHGPVVVFDSARYLAHAARLAAGLRAPRPHDARYVGYAFYLSLFDGATPGLWAPVLGQVLLSGVAAAAYFGTVRRLADGAVRPALLATALVLAWPDLQRFSAYILTESLFTSAVLLAGWALARAAYPHAALLPSHPPTFPPSHPPTLSPSNPPTLPPSYHTRWLLAGALLVLAALARPNGFLVASAAGVAALAAAWRGAGAGQRVALAAGTVALAAAAWPVLNTLADTYHLIETYTDRTVIAGYQGWLIQPAAPLVLPPAPAPQLARVAAFAAAQPVFFGQLMGAKVLAFVAYVKPFWSVGHVALGALVVWPAWVLAVRGLRRRAVPVGARWFAGALLAGQAGLVALTIEDWDARFLTPLLPVLFGLAALALHSRNAHQSVGPEITIRQRQL